MTNSTEPADQGLTKGQKLQPVRGTQDFLPATMTKYRHVLDKARSIGQLYGFDEMATPIFEQTAVFARSIGETTDVVSKEMYSFPSRSGKEQLTLRPENTAGVARAFISNGLTQALPFKCFYAGPMFRYERPQKGRYRQFHQIGVELLGVDTAQADIEVIASGAAVLRELGLLDRLTLKLNSLGDPESRQLYRDRLVAYFSDFKDRLSAESLDRLGRNPLRILDSKDKTDQEIAKGAPAFGDSLNQQSRDFFAQVREGLEKLEIQYELDQSLVRGLDYYTHTAFEFVTSELGAQSGVLGGGRYDGLIGNLGGPATPGVGWASGVERLMLLCEQKPTRDAPLALIAVGEDVQIHALKLAEDLRRAGHSVDMAYKGNMAKRLKRADKMNASHALILGEDELAAGKILIKNLSNGEQVSVNLASLVAYISEEVSKL